MSELAVICPHCEGLTTSGRQKAACYVNLDKNVYHCHQCNRSGSTDSIIDYLDEAKLEPVNEVDFDEQLVLDKLTAIPLKGLHWLSKRFPGFDPNEVVKRFDLRWNEDYDAIALLSKDLETGALVGVSYRFVDHPKQRYLSEPGSKSGSYSLKGANNDKLLITEGQFDAMTAALLGFEGEIRALGSTNLNEANGEAIRRFKHVFIALDNDEAGREAETVVLERFSWKPVTKVAIPNEFKDLNEWLQAKGLEECQVKFIEATETLVERYSRGFSQLLNGSLEFLKNRKNLDGESTGYRLLDFRLGGGLRPGEFTVINAAAKIGKSTLITNITHNLLQAGHKCAIASFEMDSKKALIPSYLSLAYRQNVRQMEGQELEALFKNPPVYFSNLYFFTQFGNTKFEMVRDWIHWAYKQGCRFVVLDHSGFMVSDMKDPSQNQQLAQSIMALVNELGIHVLCVVQAPKLDSKYQPHLDLNTTYGGVAYAMNCSNFLTAERSKQQENQLEVRVIASRYPGSRASTEPVVLSYDPEIGSLIE